MESRAELEPYRGRRVLVTGGGGFIGGHLVERLLAAGAEVASLDRAGAGVPAAARRFDADLADEAATCGALASFHPDLVFHLAAHPDAAEDLAQHRAVISANIGGVAHLLEAMRLAGCRELVYGDSTKVYGNCEVPYRASLPPQPTSSYAIAKWAGWEFCRLHRRLHGLKAVSIRPTMIYGPRQAFNLFTFVVRSALEGRPAVRLSGGSQTRDPLYIDDAVRAYLRAGSRAAAIDGSVVNIGGGTERSVEGLARETLRVLGSAATVECAEAQARPTEIWRSWCDNREARELLGWAPQVTFEEGLRRTIEFIRAARN